MHPSSTPWKHQKTGTFNPSLIYTMSYKFILNPQQLDKYPILSCYIVVVIITKIFTITLLVKEVLKNFYFVKLSINFQYTILLRSHLKHPWNFVMSNSILLNFICNNLGASKMTIQWLGIIALIYVLAKGKPSKIILQHFQIAPLQNWSKNTYLSIVNMQLNCLLFLQYCNCCTKLNLM